MRHTIENQSGMLNMCTEPRVVIFTDLDGTLLDYSSYSFEAAEPALHLIRQRGIPLVICSSKTAAEIEHYREKLKNHDPFISENGGGVFVPKGYFGSRISDAGFAVTACLAAHIEENGAYEVIRLGARYEDLRKVMENLRGKGFAVRGFGDMSAEEIGELTGLSVVEARMAQKRQFDEPFVIEGDQTYVGPVALAIEGMGFRYTLGRIGHVTGASDKGKAVSLLVSLYKADLGDVTTIGVGDAPNDVPMLRAVDYPVLVRQPDGRYLSDVKIKGLIRAEGQGSLGWNRAVVDLLTRW